MIHGEIKAQESSISCINAATSSLRQAIPGEEKEQASKKAETEGRPEVEPTPFDKQLETHHVSLKIKLENSNLLWQQVVQKAECKSTQLDKILSASVRFAIEMESLQKHLGDLDSQVNSFSPQSGMPDTVREQLAHFTPIFEAVIAAEVRVNLVEECGAQLQQEAIDDTIRIKIERELRPLEQQWAGVRNRAQEKRAKFEECLHQAEEFHSKYEALLNLVTAAEGELGQQKPVSRFGALMEDQVGQHNRLRSTLQAHKADSGELDRLGLSD